MDTRILQVLAPLRPACGLLLCLLLSPVASERAGEVYTWQDGDRTRRVWLQNELGAQPAANGSLSIVTRQNAGSDLPVFRGESGQLMTLPGGVVLVLAPGLQHDEIQGFFSANRIDPANVSPMGFADNAFLIKTEAGMPSLELANRLAEKDNVVVSSPNWWNQAKKK